MCCSKSKHLSLKKLKRRDIYLLFISMPFLFQRFCLCLKEKHLFTIIIKYFINHLILHNHEIGSFHFSCCVFMISNSNYIWYSLTYSVLDGAIKFWRKYKIYLLMYCSTRWLKTIALITNNKNFIGNIDRRAKFKHNTERSFLFMYFKMVLCDYS